MLVHLLSADHGGEALSAGGARGTGGAVGAIGTGGGPGSGGALGTEALISEGKQQQDTQRHLQEGVVSHAKVNGFAFSRLCSCLC